MLIAELAAALVQSSSMSSPLAVIASFLCCAFASTVTPAATCTSLSDAPSRTSALPQTIWSGVGLSLSSDRGLGRIAVGFQKSA